MPQALGRHAELLLPGGRLKIPAFEFSDSTGDGTFDQTNVPPNLTNIIAIAAGANHCLALLADSTVVGWGDNTYGQSTPPVGLTNVVAIASAQSHSLALLSNKTVVAWGDNGFGQTSVPTTVTNVVRIAAGGGIGGHWSVAITP